MSTLAATITSATRKSFAPHYDRVSVSRYIPTNGILAGLCVVEAHIHGRTYRGRSFARTERAAAATFAEAEAMIASRFVH